MTRPLAFLLGALSGLALVAGAVAYGLGWEHGFDPFDNNRERRWL